MNFFGTLPPPAAPWMERTTSGRSEEAEALSCEGEKVYVAVGKDAGEWKANLLWVLQNVPRRKKLVLLHVHRPTRAIPLMGGYFLAEQLNDQEIEAHRHMEFRTMNKNLSKYQTMCSKAKIKAEMLVTEADDVAEGIVKLVAQNGITELVIGAAEDKHYSKKMRGLNSKTALNVHQRADPSCKIWFICKGYLICTREAVPKGCNRSGLHSHNSSTSSSQSEMSAVGSLPKGHVRLASLLASTTSGTFSTCGSRSDSFDSRGDVSSISSLDEELKVDGIMESEPNLKDVMSQKKSTAPVYMPQIDRQFPPLPHCRKGEGENNETYRDLQNILSEAEKLQHETYSACLQLQKQGRNSNEAPHNKDTRANNEMYRDLQNILAEAEKLRSEAYMECLRHRKEGRNSNGAPQDGKTADAACLKEMMQRKESLKEMMQRKESNGFQTSDVTAIEDVSRQRDEMREELRKANEQRVQLEMQVLSSNGIIADLQEKLSEAHCLQISLEREQEELRQERDGAVREAERLREKVKELELGLRNAECFSEFSYAELQQATNNFSESLKIGEGGNGSVYKGILRHTTVAIKLLDPQGMQGKSEFYKEMDVLSKVRHPNLVTLIGACPEAWALVYEFLANGSLEDRLTRKDDTPPLTWQSRCRIAAEICSALIFLHSNKPLAVIHGDLKPANILLDANLVSRLGDFSICRPLEANANTILFKCTYPVGTFIYMDPEFLASGEPQPSSNVYSFGIILLRLLTGRPAIGIINKMRDALEDGKLNEILDSSAGEWNYEQAEQLAELGLKCCESKRQNRPDLAGDAWRLLEPMLIF